MSNDLLRRAMVALENSLDTVVNEYHDDWRHGLPSREKQLKGIKAMLDEHRAVIKDIKQELGDE